jgi:nucleoside-diphosphate-sugar epimerase
LSGSSAIGTGTSPPSTDVNRDYGALKALCERTAEQLYPGRVLNVRSGLIAGPHDPTNRFTYWPLRLARGGEVLAWARQAGPTHPQVDAGGRVRTPAGLSVEREAELLHHWHVGHG